MGVDVSLSKVKRAKAIVIRRIYESCRGEYAKIFEYQVEILRSNPGSTVAVYLDPEYIDPVFQRIYVCFDACKKVSKLEESNWSRWMLLQGSLQQ